MGSIELHSTIRTLEASGEVAATDLAWWTFYAAGGAVLVSAIGVVLSFIAPLIVQSWQSKAALKQIERQREAGLEAQQELDKQRHAAWLDSQKLDAYGRFAVDAYASAVQIGELANGSAARFGNQDRKSAEGSLAKELQRVESAMQALAKLNDTVAVIALVGSQQAYDAANLHAKRQNLILDGTARDPGFKYQAAELDAGIRAVVALMRSEIQRSNATLEDDAANN